MSILDHGKPSMCCLDERYYSATEIRRAEEALASACVIPEGWQLVPIDATKSMIDRAAEIDWGGNDDVLGNCHNMWNAMLAAAPQPPVAEPSSHVLPHLRTLIANDALAMNFQSMAQYRTMLLKAIDQVIANPPVAEPSVNDKMLAWAVERWKAEVENRPLINVHRRSLDDTWRQVIRHAGGDPVALLGPSHDDLRSKISATEWAEMNGAEAAKKGQS